MFSRETPAGYARLLYMQIKAVRDELRAFGFDAEAVYFSMISALARLAMEDGGKEKLKMVAEKLVEELSAEEEVRVELPPVQREIRH